MRTFAGYIGNNKLIGLKFFVVSTALNDCHDSIMMFPLALQQSSKHGKPAASATQNRRFNQEILVSHPGQPFPRLEHSRDHGCPGLEQVFSRLALLSRVIVSVETIQVHSLTIFRILLNVRPGVEPTWTTAGKRRIQKMTAAPLSHGPAIARVCSACISMIR